LRTIADPNAAEAHPVVYHMYVVEAWKGGDPVALGGEHSEVQSASRLRPRRSRVG
jgi:hypothetical protein